MRDANAAPLTLIDVGCGYGRDSRYLAAELGCRVLGLDPSPAAVAAARKARRPDLDVEYVAGDAASVAEAAAQAGSFDIAFACATSTTCSVPAAAGNSRRLLSPSSAPAASSF